MRSRETNDIVVPDFTARVAHWPFSHLRQLSYAKVFTIASAEGSKGKKGRAD